MYLLDPRSRSGLPRCSWEKVLVRMSCRQTLIAGIGKSQRLVVEAYGKLESKYRIGVIANRSTRAKLAGVGEDKTLPKLAALCALARSSSS